MAKVQRRTIPGHKPRRVPRFYKRVAVKLADRAEVTVVVRSKGSDEEWRRLLAASISTPPQQRQYLSRAQFGKVWGSSPKDLAAVSAYGKTYGLKTVSSDAWRRCVVLRGTLTQLQNAFGVEFYGVRLPEGTFRSYRKSPQISAELYPIVEAVLGLDDMPSTKAHAAGRSTDAVRELKLPELRKAYGFPEQFRGAGQCVAVVEYGGGIRRRDYNEYFRQIGVPPPTLRIKTISGARNQPASPAQIERLAKQVLNESDGMTYSDTTIGTWETAIDLQVVGTLAPEATLLMVLGVYDDQSQYHAWTTMLADRRPSVISCSFGEAEAAQTPKLMQVLNRWFQAAALLGVTVCCSAGDNGDGTLGESPGDLTFAVNFPGSSPYVLTCGGTTLGVAANMETAWRQSFENGMLLAGGGGFSDVFPPPSWQISAGIDAAAWIPPGATSGSLRALPDVSARANMDAAFCVIASGVRIPAGGTSAAAPIWAAVIAVLNQASNYAAGLINPLLYESLSPSLRDITEGNIGYLQAEKGWDPATGWGSPDVTAMLEILADG